MAIDFLYLGVVEPFNSLTVLPQTVLQLPILRHHISAQPMLLAFIPEPLITTTIRPRIHSEAVFFIILILSLVHAAVVPYVDSHPLHIVVKPFSLIASPIKP